MNCQVFQHNISKFVNDTINFEIMDDFLDHSKCCRECYDELEIFYMLSEGLDTIESDTTKSFDLKGSLNTKLNNYSEIAYNYFKMRVISSVTSIGANIILLVAIILQIIQIF